MAFYRGPKITTDGLVLYLDAANPKSYPGTGTTWSDLSGNGNNGTLTNGPTFDSSNKGGVVFDGIDDKFIGTSSSILSFGDGTNDTPFSLFIWVYINDFTSAPLIAKYRSFSPFRGEYSFSVSNGIPNFQCLDGATGVRVRRFSDIEINEGKYYYLGAVYNASGNDDGITLFINGEVVPSTGFGQDSNYIAMQRATNPSELTIGTFLDEGNLSFESHLDGKISQAKIYNRALTSQEVLQNYNATRSRFGL